MSTKTKETVSREIDRDVISMMASLSEIYKNKSSDEYKMHGDITLSPGYHSIERMLADLGNLKDFPSTYASDLKALFNVLHRPIFKKQVMEYLAHPSESNILITALFTVGYRLIVGELSRIYASTEATEHGIIYRPDKFTKRHDMTKFVAAYRLNVETKLDAYIKSASKEKPIQEAWYDSALTFILHAPVLGRVTNYVMNKVNDFFHTITTLNPISFIDNLFTKSYDNKVRAFEDVAAEYEATKEAYDEYMKLPDSQRNRKIEHKYVQSINKYNIKMKNMQAKIAHYDQRAIEEAKEKAESIDIDKLTSDAQHSESKPNTAANNDTMATDDDFDF